MRRSWPNRGLCLGSKFGYLGRMQAQQNANDNRNWLQHYRSKLPWFVLGSVVLGAVVGVVLKQLGVTPDQVKQWNLGLPGDVFLRGLKMVVVPLIAAAIVTGVTGVGSY